MILIKDVISYNAAECSRKVIFKSTLTVQVEHDILIKPSRDDGASKEVLRLNKK